MAIVGKLLRTGCRIIGRMMPLKKNKIVFSSYCGRGYSDNPKAIAEELLRRGTGADMVWLVKDKREAATLPHGIRPCIYGSYRHILELSTARVWVDNCRKYDKNKRKNQFYLQTWHGFPLKRIEGDAEEALEEGYVFCAKRDSSFTDLLLAYSETDAEILKNCFWYDGEIAVWGVPRTDVFVNADEGIKEKVRAAFSLPADRRLVLYAPTFRADHSVDAYKLDAAQLKSALVKRFPGEWTVLIRLHPNIAKKSEGLFPYDGEGIVDATMYPDMQDLLVGSDILITDYSSSMFDFGLSGKPCFRYASDIEDYMKDRNFYFDFEELPFPAAYSADELISLCENFSEEKYSSDREEFYKKLAFVEDGKASVRCADWIEEKLK